MLDSQNELEFTEKLENSRRSFEDIIFLCLSYEPFPYPSMSNKEVVDLSFNRIVNTVSDLGDKVETGDVNGVVEEGGVLARLIIREMCSNYSALSPYEALWAKYLGNYWRFLPLSYLGKTEEGWNNTLKTIKHLQGYEDPDEYGLAIIRYRGLNGYNPEIGSNDLRVLFEEVEKWLETLPRKFPIEDLYIRMNEEVSECLERKIEIDKLLLASRGHPTSEIFSEMVKLSFELSDIFIYLCHILGVTGVNVVDAISSIEDEKYCAVLGVSSVFSKGIRIVNKRLYNIWLNKMYKIYWKDYAIKEV